LSEPNRFLLVSGLTLSLITSCCQEKFCLSSSVPDLTASLEILHRLRLLPMTGSRVLAHGLESKSGIANYLHNCPSFLHILGSLSSAPPHWVARTAGFAVRVFLSGNGHTSHRPRTATAAVCYPLAGVGAAGGQTCRSELRRSASMGFLRSIAILRLHRGFSITEWKARRETDETFETLFSLTPS